VEHDLLLNHGMTRHTSLLPAIGTLAVLALTAPAFAGGDPLGALDAKARKALAIQVTLDRAGFSPGEIDAASGTNTSRAASAFERARGSAPEEHAEPVVTYEITPDDAAGPFAEVPADMMEKSKLPSLGYASMLEMLAERFHASPKLLQRLNPAASFAAGDKVVVPNVEPFTPPVTPAPGETPGQARSAKPAAARLVVTVTDRTKSLEVKNEAGEIVLYAPVTVGSERDPLPVGEWKVTGVSQNPPFNYNPDLFWDADASHSKAKIAPGPNNPVGVVWIDLTKEHYGIHGTPEPNRIGYTQSHGCIRLTNWDAMRLAALVSPGTKVVLSN
jgi:lipoprotein-anchoring transpeptidase ErfK/SrfK